MFIDVLRCIGNLILYILILLAIINKTFHTQRQNYRSVTSRYIILKFYITVILYIVYMYYDMFITPKYSQIFDSVDFGIFIAYNVWLIIIIYKYYK